MYTEKELEDYIVEDIDHMKYLIEASYKSGAWNSDGWDAHVSCIGRQVRIGQANIMDICYEVSFDNIVDRDLVIVELKSVKGNVAALAQLCRYINVAKARRLDYRNVYGLLVAPDFDENLREIQAANMNPDIQIASFIYAFDFIFNLESYTRDERHVLQLPVDERLRRPVYNKKLSNTDECETGQRMVDN
ncbi:endonuclease NucS [Christensenellaceae bacterium OttesenSCG-928-L17]|nr:endonuclease NucS [Christensenellaceae bacterium OttesenSCG-928-L17]